MKNIFPLILALILLVAASVGYGYLYLAVVDGMNRSATAHAEAADAEARDNASRVGTSLLSSIAKERTEAESYVAQDADLVSVIDTITAAAKREHVVPTIGSVSVGTSKAQYHELVILTLSAKGTFPNLTRFTEALETLPFASRVTAVSFEVSSDKTWFEDVTVEFIKKKQ